MKECEQERDGEGERAREREEWWRQIRDTEETEGRVNRGDKGVEEPGHWTNTNRMSHYMQAQVRFGHFL